MLRKLVSAIVILTLATFGLSQASPASAAGTFSPPLPLNVNVAAEMNALVAGTDQFAIGFGTTWDSESYTRSLKVFQVRLDGTVANEQTLATGVRTNFELSADSITGKLSENGIVVTWIQSTDVLGQGMGDSSRNSSVYSIYTADGLNWSLPVEVFPVVSHPQEDCYLYYSCGYRELKTVMDSRGVLATSLNLSAGQNTSTLLKTSNDGVTWGTSNRVGGNLRFPNIVKIQPLEGGGFMALFTGNDGANTNIYVTKTTNSRYAFWSTPVKVLNNNYSSNMQLVSKGQGQYDLIFQSMSNTETIINRINFDSTLNTWSAAEVLSSTPNSFLGSRIEVAQAGNRFVLAFSAGTYGTQESKVIKVEVRDNVAKPSEVIASGSHQNVQVFGLRINGDSSVTLAYSGPTFAPTLLSISANGTVSLSDIPMGVSGGDGAGVVSPSGNMFVYLYDSNDNNAIRTIVYQAAEAPIPTGLMKMSGTAKVAATLSATVPTFSSRSGIGTTSIQWYSCRTKVATVQTTVPAGCVAIAKAKATKFKVTTKQKNKYIAIGVTNTNAVATTTLFSPTTAKTK